MDYSYNIYHNIMSLYTDLSLAFAPSKSLPSQERLSATSSHDEQVRPDITNIRIIPSTYVARVVMEKSNGLPGWN